MIKCRFQGLREIRIDLSCNDDLEMITKYIMAGYIIHNILIDITDTFWEDFNSVTPEDTNTVGLEFDTGSQEEEADVQLTAREEGPYFREKVKEYVLKARGIPF
ncbi:MAG: hypothetical protein AAF599_13090 [Bacteroidota bacterium]